MADILENPFLTESESAVSNADHRKVLKDLMYRVVYTVGTWNEY